MAFWRLKQNQVYVLYWDGTKQRSLPRKKTKHLDGLSTEVIGEWVQRWSNLNEVQKVRPDLTPIPLDWDTHTKRFAEYMLTVKSRDQSTVDDHTRHILTALPFFIDADCTSFADFPNHSRKLGPWLRDHAHKSSRRIYAINQSMKLFWSWLDAEGLAEGTLRLTAGYKVANKTPLQHTLTPDEMLHLFTRPDIRLIAILGYFFSLRPQEILAVYR